MNINCIGKIKNDKHGSRIIIKKEYISGLIGIEDFKHLNVLWWFSQTDNEESRTKLVEKSPYNDPPKTLGIFATRSPNRPNPIGLTGSVAKFINKRDRPYDFYILSRYSQ